MPVFFCNFRPSLVNSLRMITSLPRRGVNSADLSGMSIANDRTPTALNCVASAVAANMAGRTEGTKLVVAMMPVSLSHTSASPFDGIWA